MGFRCLAAPPWNFGKETISAVSPSLPTLQMSQERKGEWGKILLKVAGEVSREI